ncbi:MAG: hypothetical protein GY754_12705 [bacterium]|nr:hypothetical protein [bacterium]
MIILIPLFSLNLYSAVPIPSEPDGSFDLGAVPGEWKFTRGDNLNYRLPEWDDKEWQAIASIPHNWGERSPRADCQGNFGWYRIRLRFPQKLHSIPLMFRLGPINSADEVSLFRVRRL